MKHAPRQLRQAWFRVPPFSCFARVLLLVSLSPANGQDIRGMEVCTAEKQMERRTSCLQANVEFLQQALMKLDREFRDKSTAADRDLAEVRTEIAALKSKIEQLNSEFAKMKAKAEPNFKK